MVGFSPKKATKSLKGKRKKKSLKTNDLRNEELKSE